MRSKERRSIVRAMRHRASQAKASYAFRFKDEQGICYFRIEEVSGSYVRPDARQVNGAVNTPYTRRRRHYTRDRLEQATKGTDLL